MHFGLIQFPSAENCCSIAGMLDGQVPEPTINNRNIGELMEWSNNLRWPKSFIG